jgi:cyanophycinase
MSGTLFAIGGAEARLRRRRVLDAFVAAAGGTEARIALVSSASSLGREVVEVYRSVFTSLGARQVISLRPEIARRPTTLISLSRSTRSVQSS